MKKSTKHSKPYWTDRLTVLCENMKAARTTYNKRNTDPNKQAMIETKELFDLERKAECQRFIMEKTKQLNAADAQKFWKEFNKIFKRKSDGSVDPLEDGNGGLITEHKEMEEKLFGTFFQCKHMTDADFDEYFYEETNKLYEELKEQSRLASDEDEEQAELNADISIGEILKAIRKTDPKKLV